MKRLLCNQQQSEDWSDLAQLVEILDGNPEAEILSPRPIINFWNTYEFCSDILF